MDGAPVIGEDVLVFGQGIVGLLTTSILAGFPLANLITLDQYALRRQTSREAVGHRHPSILTTRPSKRCCKISCQTAQYLTGVKVPQDPRLLLEQVY